MSPLFFSGCPIKQAQTDHLHAPEQNTDEFLLGVTEKKTGHLKTEFPDVALQSGTYTQRIEQ